MAGADVLIDLIDQDHRVARDRAGDPETQRRLDAGDYRPARLRVWVCRRKAISMTRAGHGEDRYLRRIMLDGRARGGFPR
jgi:hypothetical protein